MTETEIRDTVIRVMRETFQDASLQVARETSAKDVDGWDSLSNIELLVALQAAFGIRFNTGEIAGLKNVGELLDTIAARVR